MDSVFIEDGYTCDGYVAAIPGLHGSLSFKFRPALYEEFNRYVTEAARDRTKADLALIDKHTITWDASKEKNAGTIARLHTNIIKGSGGMLDQILGYTPAQAMADAKN